MGEHFDSADFDKALTEALRLVDYDSVRKEQQRRRQEDDDLLLGIGISCYVEVSAGTMGFDAEYASVEAEQDGTVTVVAGTSGHGQGHWTTYAQIVSERDGRARRAGPAGAKRHRASQERHGHRRLAVGADRRQRRAPGLR